MRYAVLALALLACDPVDFDFDLDLSFGDHTVGELGTVTFSLVDGCPDEGFFGCPNALPPFAVHARPRFVIGSVDGSVESEHRLARASARSTNPSVAASRIDDTGTLVVQTTGAGRAEIEIVDGDTVIDRIALEVAEIRSLDAGPESTTVLLATPIGARVYAKDSLGRLLYAHGAITTRTAGALTLYSDNSGFFGSSDQTVVIGDAIGDATVTYVAGDVHLDVTYQVVTRLAISRVAVNELTFGEAAGNKTRLYATAYVGAAELRGGPACEWSVVSGGGPGAALAGGDHDDTRWTLFVFYTQAILFGAGDTVVECRANRRAAGQATVHLLP